MRAEELANALGDELAFLFEGEVSGVEQVDLGLGEIRQVRARAVRTEDLVVLAPGDQRRGWCSRKYL